jgi:peroxiredoxin
VLGAWAKAADQCRAAGATLFAVTPEAGGRALRTKVDHNLDFDVLCDLDNVLALECGLVYPVSEELRQGYLARGFDFEKIYGNTAWMLPAPATFIVRPNGVIAHATVDADFRYRQEPSEILRLLATLR